MHAHITRKEVVYIVVFMATAAWVFNSGIHLSTLFSLNGALLGYVYIILIPIYMHLKCIYYDRSSGLIEDDEDWNRSLVQNCCECSVVFSAKWKLVIETIFLLVLVLVGFGMLVLNLMANLGVPL